MPRQTKRDKRVLNQRIADSAATLASLKLQRSKFKVGSLPYKHLSQKIEEQAYALEQLKGERHGN